MIPNFIKLLLKNIMETKKLPSWLVKFLISVGSLLIGLLSEHYVENTEVRNTEKALKIELSKQAIAEAQLNTVTTYQTLADCNSNPTNIF